MDQQVTYPMHLVIILLRAIWYKKRRLKAVLSVVSVYKKQRQMLLLLLFQLRLGRLVHQSDTSVPNKIWSISKTHRWKLIYHVNAFVNVWVYLVIMTGVHLKNLTCLSSEMILTK